MTTAVLENTLKQRFDIPETALGRVMSEAPYFPRVSDNKSAALSRPIEFAIRWPYMQLNRRDFVSWLVFDCDHSDVFRWEQVGLPAPNLIVSNGKDGKTTGFHLMYAISPVCTSEQARSHPIRYLRACYTEMGRLLGSDPDYHGGPICKTPGHAWWHTVELHAHEYSLGELNEYFDIPSDKPQFSKGPDTFGLTHSRALTLFEQLRYYAYSVVNDEREKGNFGTFTRRLDAYANQINDFERRGFRDFKTGAPKGNLPASDLRYTIKSIARWTWDKYTGNARCNRGVMRLAHNLPLNVKQGLAAKRTHSERVNDTSKKVRNACAVLQAQGKKLTQTAIACFAQLTRQTVAKYQSLVDEFLKSKPSISLVQGVAPGRKQIVKLGAHQVTTPPVPAGESGTKSGKRGATSMRLRVVSGKPPPLDSS